MCKYRVIVKRAGWMGSIYSVYGFHQLVLLFERSKLRLPPYITVAQEHFTCPIRGGPQALDTPMPGILPPTRWNRGCYSQTDRLCICPVASPRTIVCSAQIDISRQMATYRARAMKAWGSWI